MCLRRLKVCGAALFLAAAAPVLFRDAGRGPLSGTRINGAGGNNTYDAGPLQRGKPFVDASTAAMVDHIRRSAR
ncbi:MAG: hypothetical protein ACE15B_06455 [Bryobacteraceae bacterium]